MKLLAIDTSSLSCAVGLRIGDDSISRYAEEPRAHTRLLMPMINECLGEAAVTLDELDAIVLGNGPGSFIGMRIAASVAQGLAFGAGLDVVPVSSLAVVAHAAGRPGELVAVAQDAHMSEVYLGLFRMGNTGAPDPLVPERLQSQVSIPELADAGEIVTAGCGWKRYPLLLEANRSLVGRQSEVYYPAPESLLELGKFAWQAGGQIAPADVNPAYLRQKVAEKPVPATT